METKAEVKTTAIEGMLVFQPHVFSDSRGQFYESWRQDTYRQAGIAEDLVQDNISVSRHNVLRGLHYNLQQGQLAWVSHGAVLDVVVDIRPASPTFKTVLTFDLTAEAPQQIYMPPGCAHGFYVKSDLAIMNYKCSQYYAPTNEQGLHWQDPTLNIPWPTNQPIISERDLAFPRLDEVLSSL